MNKKHLLAALAAFGLLGSRIVFATVGGPTIIESLLYSSSKQDVIYQQQSYSGKGCPPEIYGMNLNTGAITSYISCRDADLTDSASYNAGLERFLAQYPNLLKHVDLNKNKITAQVSRIGGVEPNENTGTPGRTDFRLDIFQNGIKKTSVTYSGCSVGQTHVIEGYIIPNTPNITILVGTKSDCWEGGYTGEKLYAVPNVTLYDQSPLPLKNRDEAKSGPGNLTITAFTKAPVQSNATTAPTPSQIDNDTASPSPARDDRTIIYLSIIVALIAVILVLVIKRR